MKPTNKDIGKLVKLKENKKEGWPEQKGKFLGIDKHNPTVGMIELLPEFRDNYYGIDDGLRECGMDNWELIL